MSLVLILFFNPALLDLTSSLILHDPSIQIRFHQKFLIADFCMTVGMPAYVAVEVPKHLDLDGESLTVEVWLSTTQGGPVLNLCPAEDSPFGANLSIGEAGRINFG